MSLHRLLLATLVCACASATAQTTTAWNEAVSGDLSNTGTSPTALTLVPGSNLIFGTTGRTAGVVDRDYFTFTLPAGSQLDTLTVLSGSSFGGVSFIAVQSGPQVTVNPTGGSATGLLGWVHYGENDLGTDILGLMGIGQGAIGFAGPLTAGTYAFWIQDTATGSFNYRFDFSVSAVPEVPTALSLMAGMAALASLRRRR